jgi:hypothetical protein
MSLIEYETKILDEISIDYGRVELPTDLRVMIEGVAKIYSDNVNMSELAMRGFILMSIKQFQMEQEITFEEWSKLPATDMDTFLRLDKEIRTILFTKIGNCIKNRNDEKNEILLNAIKQSQKFVFSTMGISIDIKQLDKYD